MLVLVLKFCILSITTRVHRNLINFFNIELACIEFQEVFQDSLLIKALSN